MKVMEPVADSRYMVEDYNTGAFLLKGAYNE